ncbi:HAD family hydrolase [Bordetella petrii]|uniref:HAD family hydrolase n=1 Tax=Bordetella petrii TaxID=94624 RepID=UPI001E2AED59|nr:HAD-IA family hydrolase [Bordetella petrii]MCD0501665.1 HAD-IA family hydrolase [Bordetella petrii]
MTAFPFDAVLFDCDGVLVDSEPITARVLSTMLGELGWPITQDETLRVFVGKTVKDEAALIQSRTGFALTPEWLADFRARRNQALEQDLQAIAGAAQAVQALHGTLAGRIAVGSGADVPKIELQLRKVGVHEYFEGRIFSGQEQARNKPAPDVYLAAAHTLGVAPQRCAVIEDTVTGTAAGVAAGATVVGYSPGGPGHHGTAALLRAGAAQVFHDMQALPALLARAGAAAA